MIVNFIMRSTYCIYPVSSTQQISKSPINTSPSKQLYSFSKDSRFKYNKPKYVPTHIAVIASMKYPLTSDKPPHD